MALAPEVQVAIIDHNHPLGKIAKGKRQLLGLIVELEHSKDNSFAAYGAKWLKGVKLIVCGNERSLVFLKNIFRDIGEL